MRFFPRIAKASHLYLWHCFFQRGGTLFSGHGSASILEHSSLINTLLLEGGLPRLLLLLFGGDFFLIGGFVLLHSLMYISDVCRNGGVLITPSIHASSFISLFGGGFFPCGFSLFPHFMRDFHLHSLCTWVPKMT